MTAKFAFYAHLEAPVYQHLEQNELQLFVKINCLQTAENSNFMIHYST